MFSLAATWFYSTDSGAQKQPVMPCDQNHLEVERKTKKRKRGGGEKEEVIEENLEKEEDEKEKKNKKRYQKKKFVSRPLMDTLWAMFKFKKNPTFQDISSLALEFSMTATQVWPHVCLLTKSLVYNSYPYKPLSLFLDESPLNIFFFFFLQINRWFCKKRKIYKKEIHWRAYKNRRGKDVWHVEHKMEKIHWPLETHCVPTVEYPINFLSYFSVPSTDINTSVVIPPFII